MFTPAPVSVEVPASEPAQPEPLYDPALGNVTAAVGAVESFWSVKLVVELGLPAVSLAKTSTEALPLVGAV